jgi:zinc protease
VKRKAQLTILQPVFEFGKDSLSHYLFRVHIGCSPANLNKVIASTLDEINKLKVNGPLQENIDKWRAEDKLSRDVQQRTNYF